MKKRALRRGRGPRRRQDHRLRQVRRRADRPAAGRRRDEPVARRPVLAGRHPRQRRRPRLLRCAQPDRRGHRPRRHPRGPGPATSAPASATRSPTSPRSRTGSCRTGRPARRSTDWPPPWHARPARRCCATPAASATTPSSRCSPRAWCSPASPCRSAGDSRPASGACHEINHAFDLLYPKRAAEPRRAVRPRRRVRHAPARGQGDRRPDGRGAAPARPAGAAREIGFTDEEFVQAVEYAPQTRPGRYTILEHLDLSTDQIRDAYADYAQAIGS